MLRFTKTELILLRELTSLPERLTGALDYENNNEEEFKEHYGLTKDEADQSAISAYRKIIFKIKTLTS